MTKDSWRNPVVLQMCPLGQEQRNMYSHTSWEHLQGTTLSNSEAEDYQPPAGKHEVVTYKQYKQQGESTALDTIGRT